MRANSSKELAVHRSARHESTVMVRRSSIKMKPSVASFAKLVEDQGVRVYDAAHPEYRENTKPWSLAYDKHPTVLLIPQTVEQLQLIVKTLYDHEDIDFAIRGRGCGSASASDVLVSLSAKPFQEISLVSSGATHGLLVDVGGGTEWGAVDAFMEEHAPGNVVVGARCPYVGVAGSTLQGGFSWLSHEYGLASDPQNLMDMQIILRDGSLVWAGQHDPELLWALRGGGGNFGVVTKVRFHAHEYRQRPFSGFLFFPKTSLRQVSAEVARWTNETGDPKMALHILIVGSGPSLALHGESLEPLLMALIYDAHGEAHARSAAGFKWIFEIDGVKEGEGTNKPREMSLREVNELTRDGQDTHAAGCSWLQAPMVGEGPTGRIDEDLVVRAWSWYEMVVKTNNDLSVGTLALLEIMQAPTFTSVGSFAKTGWPHGGKGRRQVLQLSTGSKPVTDAELPALQDRALKLMKEAPTYITGTTEHPPSDFIVNCPLPNHDLRAMFGSNWESLRRIKGKFDPRQRFNKPFNFPINSVENAVH